jgi:hypothetical protein
VPVSGYGTGTKTKNSFPAIPGPVFKSEDLNLNPVFSFDPDMNFSDQSLGHTKDDYR